MVTLSRNRKFIIKSEIRISKSETNSKFKLSKFKTPVWNICILKIRACFEFRASNLEFPSLYKDPGSFER
jgi:hypothetical protein